MTTPLAASNTTLESKYQVPAARGLMIEQTSSQLRKATMALNRNEKRG